VHDHRALDPRPGAASNQDKDKAMIIGRFQYDSKQNEFKGVVALLTRRLDVRFAPAEKQSRNSPDFRVMTMVDNEEIELGAGWKKTSQKKEAFVSVTIDDPTLSAPIHCALLPEPDSRRSYVLMWKRRSVRDSEPS
jgi:uncharacterized protein (DUF736 family)